MLRLLAPRLGVRFCLHQFLVEPSLHFASGLLCERNGRDGLHRRARPHKRQHTADERGGLARAGRGANHEVGTRLEGIQRGQRVLPPGPDAVPCGSVADGVLFHGVLFRRGIRHEMEGRMDLKGSRLLSEIG